MRFIILANLLKLLRKRKQREKLCLVRQQIPGDDVSLRVADVSFEGDTYARVEIIKGSSALEAAQKIAKQWDLLPLMGSQVMQGSQSIESIHPVTLSLTQAEIESEAIRLCQVRGYPTGLGRCLI